MANAAAKKAAAAQKNATSKLLPILLGLNFLHFFIIFQRGKFSTYRIFMTILQWILTYISYQGIILDVAQSTNTVHSTFEKKLAGGAWLDLLFLILLSQFGSLFFYEVFMDLILFLIPVIYGLYHYFVKQRNGGAGAIHGGSNHGKEPQDEETRKLLEERRRKRAERRRQKRM